MLLKQMNALSLLVVSALKAKEQEVNKRKRHIWERWDKGERPREPKTMKEREREGAREIVRDRRTEAENEGREKERMRENV